MVGQMRPGFMLQQMMNTSYPGQQHGNMDHMARMAPGMGQRMHHPNMMRPMMGGHPGHPCHGYPTNMSTANSVMPPNISQVSMHPSCPMTESQMVVFKSQIAYYRMLQGLGPETMGRAGLQQYVPVTLVQEQGGRLMMVGTTWAAAAAPSARQMAMVPSWSQLPTTTSSSRPSQLMGH